MGFEDVGRTFDRTIEELIVRSLGPFTPPAEIDHVVAIRLGRIPMGTPSTISKANRQTFRFRGSDPLRLGLVVHHDRQFDQVLEHLPRSVDVLTSENLPPVSGA